MHLDHAVLANLANSTTSIIMTNRSTNVAVIDCIQDTRSACDVIVPCLPGAGLGHAKLTENGVVRCLDELHEETRSKKQTIVLGPCTPPPTLQTSVKNHRVNLFQYRVY